MKRILPLVLCSLCILQGGPLQAQSNEADIRYVVARYLDAMGGAAALERIKSARLAGTISFPDGSSHRITVLKKKPNKVRVTVDTGVLRYIQAYDGKVAWISRERGRQQTIERMVGSSAAQFIREAPLENVLINDAGRGAVITLGEMTELVGQPCHQIIATFPDGSRSVHVIEATEFIERRILQYNPDGELTNEMVPGDFEKVDGVVFAKQITRMRQEEVISVLQIDTVELNIGILDAAFTPLGELPEE